MMRMGQAALTDPTEFTIARRIVREPAIARQLAITPDQMSKLQAIVSTPAVQGNYLGSLPVPDEMLTEVENDWTTYVRSQSISRSAAESTLVQSAQRAGDQAMNKARSDYTASLKAITSILTQQQIQAYSSGKTLPAP